MDGDEFIKRSFLKMKVKTNIDKILEYGSWEGSTVYYIKHFFQINEFNLEYLYHRKNEEIHNLMMDLHKRGKGFDFVTENNVSKCPHELAWKVGYLFQHATFYEPKHESHEIPTYCLLNQPKVNRRPIDEMTLLQHMHYLRDVGTDAFDENAALIAPYEVSKRHRFDSNNNITSSLVFPMVPIPQDQPNSKCFACPITFSTVEALFNILTGRYIDKRTFPKLFAKGVSEEERIHFALYAVMEAFEKVYNNFKLINNLQELLLVCYLHLNDNKVINLEDFKNDSILTLPIGFRELMKQTKIMFQAITPIRFSWLNCQMKQSAVTTYLVGKNPFYCNERFAMSFENGINDHLHHVGLLQMDYWQGKIDRNFEGKYSSNLLFVKHNNDMGTDEETDNDNVYTLSENYGAKTLLEMSSFFDDMSRKKRQTAK